VSVFKLYVEQAEKGDLPDWNLEEPRTRVFVGITLDEELWWSFDDIPDWLDYELSEVGWQTVFDIHDPEKFALEHGLCPGQEFTIVVHPPTYTTDYWGEHDVEYDWEMLGPVSLPPEVHLERWQDWLEQGQDEEYLERLHAFTERLTVAKEG